MGTIEFFGFNPDTNQKVPFFTMSVSAGLPVPVEDDVARDIDLNEFLVEHPNATFFAKISGKALEDVGIYDGDVLVIDSSIDPKDQKLVIVTINGEMTVKFYREIDGVVYLQSRDKRFIPMKIEPYMEFHLIGVVTKIIHSL